MGVFHVKPTFLTFCLGALIYHQKFSIYFRTGIIAFSDMNSNYTVTYTFLILEIFLCGVLNSLPSVAFHFLPPTFYNSPHAAATRHTHCFSLMLKRSPFCLLFHELVHITDYFSGLGVYYFVPCSLFYHSYMAP
jgi:hypothetical protein